MPEKIPPKDMLENSSLFEETENSKKENYLDNSEHNAFDEEVVVAGEPVSRKEAEKLAIEDHNIISKEPMFDSNPKSLYANNFEEPAVDTYSLKDNKIDLLSDDDKSKNIDFDQPMVDEKDDVDNSDTVEVDVDNDSKKIVATKPAATSKSSFFSKKSSTVKKSSSRIIKEDIASENNEQQPVEKTIEQITSLLNNNDPDAALPLAQELVWGYPSLSLAKILIARCFMQKNEFSKGIAILQNIVNSSDDPEALYYLAVCYNAGSDNTTALKYLKQAKGLDVSNDLKKKIQDMMAKIQGEDMVCPECNKKQSPNNFVYVNNSYICKNCDKKNKEEDLEGDNVGQGEKSKYKKRYRFKKSSTVTILFKYLLLVVLVVSAFLLVTYHFLPNLYYEVRMFLPQEWSFIPNHVDEGYGDNGKVGPLSPKVVNTFQLASAPISKAIVGVKLVHKLDVAGLEEGRYSYSMLVDPEPEGKYTFSKNTGDFIWTPDKKDANKTFKITFQVATNIIKSLPQINEVTVSPGMVFTTVGNVGDIVPGSLELLTPVNTSNNKTTEILLSQGNYTDSKIDLLSFKNNVLEIDKTGGLKGRAIALGYFKISGQLTFSVVDFWLSKIKFFTIGKNNIEELALSIDLPGKPVHADFDSDNNVLVVLCKIANQFKVLLYQFEVIDRAVLLAEWDAPASGVFWSKIKLMPDKEMSQDKGYSANIILLNGDINTAPLYIKRFSKSENTNWQGVGKYLGTVLDCAVDKDTESIAVMIDEANKTSLFRYGKDSIGRWQSNKLQYDDSHIEPFGLFYADIDGDGIKDIVALDKNKIITWIVNSFDIKNVSLASWSMPNSNSSPPTIGGVCVVSLPEEDALVYINRLGDLVLGSLVFSKENEGE